MTMNFLKTGPNSQTQDQTPNKMYDKFLNNLKIF
jgi:hypothetical protein